MPHVVGVRSPNVLGEVLHTTGIRTLAAMASLSAYSKEELLCPVIESI